MSELINKLSKIAASAGNIKKNGWNAHHKYPYLKIDDIYDHFNKPLSDNGVTFGTKVKEWMIQGNLIVGVVEGVFTDGESIHTCEVGSAASAGDKMMRNLMQNAVKQIFLQVFCISSGDVDPDGETNTPLEEKTKPKTQEKVYPIPVDKWEAVKPQIQSLNGVIATVSNGTKEYKAKLTDKQVKDYLDLRGLRESGLEYQDLKE